MGRLLVVIIPLALLIYAFIDCVRTPEESMPSGIPKPLWLVLILFPVLGPLAWILISRIARAASSPSGRSVVWTSESPRRPVRRPGPTAPDDDPEFLARLAREQRRAQRGPHATDADDATGSTPDAGDVRPGRATERGSTGHLGTPDQSTPGTSPRAEGTDGSDGRAGPDPDDGRGAPGTDANPNGTHT